VSSGAAADREFTTSLRITSRQKPGAFTGSQRAEVEEARGLRLSDRRFAVLPFADGFEVAGQVVAIIIRSMAAEPHFDSVTAVTVGRERRQDAYYVRFFSTACLFCLFGISALVVGAVLLPIVKLIPAARERKRARARRVAQITLRSFIALAQRSRTMSYELRGASRLGRPGQLIVANHPTLIDVVFLLAFTRAAGCVVKQGLWRNPLTRWAVTLAEYTTNDPAVTMLEGATRALQEGQSLIIFPEGTRTVPGRPLVFHRGAANVALRAAAVVTPVYIRCEPVTLTKNEPWYRVPPRRPHFTLVVGEDFELAPYRPLPLPLGSRAFNEHLQAQFQAFLSART
jgi:1-acyl-sn-glycerol-3-phosphate acyltransferase